MRKFISIMTTRDSIDIDQPVFKLVCLLEPISGLYLCKTYVRFKFNVKFNNV